MLQPEMSVGPTPARLVWKRCFGCEGYFQGPLDGGYRCPGCVHRVDKLRPRRYGLLTKPAHKQRNARAHAA